MNSARDEEGRERTCRGRGRASERESERARKRGRVASFEKDS